MIYYMEDFKNLINFNFKFSLEPRYSFFVRFIDKNVQNVNEKYDYDGNKVRKRKEINQEEKLAILNSYIDYEGKFINKDKSYHNLGLNLLAFLNHYNKILQTIELYENKLNKIIDTISIKSESDYEYFCYATSLLDELALSLSKIEGLRNCSMILQNEISSFNSQFNAQISQYHNFLKDKIELIKLENNIVESDYIKVYEQQLRELNTLKIYKYHYINFIKKFKSYIMKLYMTSKSAFVPLNDIKATDNSTKVYNSKHLSLPPVEFFFETNNEKLPSVKIIKYTYKLSSIEDLVSISLYHIFLSKKVLLKCENCGDYFLPRVRNDEKYCNKIIKQDSENNNLYCGDIGKRKKYNGKSNTISFYRYLLHRINKRIERTRNTEFLTKMLSDIEEMKEELLDKNNHQNTKNNLRKFHKYLVEKDKEYQKQFPNPKYTSDKYWKFND